MPYTITIYLKSDNDIYMKFGAEFSKFISETDLNHWEETAINALISMSGGTKAMIISKSEYEENIDETESIQEDDQWIKEEEEQFIEANKNIKDIVNTDTAIINCGAYGKGRIYNLEMSVENESNS